MPTRTLTRASVAAFAATACLATPACASPSSPVTTPGTAMSTPTRAASPEKAIRYPHGFVDVHKAVPSILIDARYYTKHDFEGRRITGYQAPKCLLSGPAAKALGHAQAAFRKQGYTIKVYDCYRPQRAVNDFVSWSKRTKDQKMKREFYPYVAKSKLFADGYIAKKSGHSKGSTMDLTLVKLPAKKQSVFHPGQRLLPCTGKKRFGDNSIDMGTGFDCFDPRAHTMDQHITGTPHRNRLKLRATMSHYGFVNYADEWWHYTLKNEPYPNTYFDFPIH